MNRARALIGEAVADLRGQRAKAAALLAVLTAVAALALLVERDAASARVELDRLLDAPSSTVIRFKSQDSTASIPGVLVAAAANLSGVRAAFGIGAPDIAEPHGIPAEQRNVVLRDVIGEPGWSTPPACGAAWMSRATATRLGLADGVGALAVPGTGRPTVPVMSTPGAGGVPEFLTDTALVRSCAVTPVTELVLVATDPGQVAPVVAATEQLFPVQDRPTLRVESHAGRIADARTASDAAQRSAARLAAGTAIAASLLATLVLTGLVLQRRRDFGRRRALGATRSDIVTLIVLESLTATMLASMIAATIVEIAQLVSSRPATPPSYLAGALLMFICAGTAGGILPGLLASSRDPAREIRVP